MLCHHLARSCGTEGILPGLLEHPDFCQECLAGGIGAFVARMFLGTEMAE